MWLSSTILRPEFKASDISAPDQYELWSRLLHLDILETRINGDYLGQGIQEWTK